MRRPLTYLFSSWLILTAGGVLCAQSNPSATRWSTPGSGPSRERFAPGYSPANSPQREVGTWGNGTSEYSNPDHFRRSLPQSSKFEGLSLNAFRTMRTDGVASPGMSVGPSVRPPNQQLTTPSEYEDRIPHPPFIPERPDLSRSKDFPTYKPTRTNQAELLERLHRWEQQLEKLRRALETQSAGDSKKWSSPVRSSPNGLPPGTKLPPMPTPEKLPTPRPHLPDSKKCGPWVKPSKCRSRDYCLPLSQAPAFSLPEKYVTQKFYRCCYEFVRTIPLPVQRVERIELWKFGPTGCPSQSCQQPIGKVGRRIAERRGCTVQPRKVRLRACVRTVSGRVDLYVLHYPGMPTEWVLELDKPRSYIEQKYRVALGPQDRYESQRNWDKSR